MADALLDDLDDLSDVDEEDRAKEVPLAFAAADDDVGGDKLEKNGGDYGDGRSDDAEADGGALNGRAINGPTDAGGGVNSVEGTAEVTPATTKPAPRRLLDDARFASHLADVRAVKKRGNGGDGVDEDGKPPALAASEAARDERDREEDDVRHDLILASNRHLVSLSNEIHRAHSDLCRRYRPKFPELEDLLTDPFQYRAAVGILRNEMDVASASVHERLTSILTSNQIITISVAGATQGRPLTESELRGVDAACLYLDELALARTDLSTFVESRMERWSPSICALVGPAVAAQLLGSTGGLAELSRVPACNLQLLGRVRSTASSRAGFATSARTHHAGWIVDCDLVRGVSNRDRMRALKTVAGKLALAVRADYVNGESGRKRTPDVGRKFAEELRVKFAKWEEPDKAQAVKALPKPDLTTKKRRGGRRIRRLKERFEETELMKQANKRAFSVEAGEYGDDAMGLTLGLLDQKEGGAMRQTAEKRKTRQANTKASRKRAIQMSSGATNGLASSMVFTPVQGLELVNPDANRERVRQANAKWFSENAGFQSALPKK